jgi:hypothetical protein
VSRYPSDKPTRIVAVDDVGAVWVEMSSPEVWHHAMFARNAPDTSASVAEQRHVLSELAATGTGTFWVLSHASMPCWLQVPPQDTRSLKELQAVVHSRARQWLNPAHVADELLVHADWSAHYPFFCETLPAYWQVLLGSTPRVSSPLRLGLARLTRRRPPPGWYAITTPDEAHLLLHHKGHWQQLRSLRLRGSGATAVIAEQVHGEWQRERLRQPGHDGHLNWIHLGHTDAGWKGSDLQWLDVPWQQQINKIPERPAVPGALTKAGHQLWAFQHLGFEGAAR